jgi:hypothetical protein
VTSQARRPQVTEIEEQATEDEQPVAESVQAREGHVARSNHQRHEIIAESGNDRHAHQKDHRRAVHGEKTIEYIGFKQGVTGDHQLQANGDSQQACDDQEHKSGSDVHEA